MENENKKILIELTKKNKTIMKVAVGFLLASIFCLCIGIIISKRTLPDPVDVNKTEKNGQYVECNVVALTDSYAEYTEDDVVQSEYYLAASDDCIYIIEMNRSTYLDMSNKFDAGEYIVAYGMSGYLNPELKDITIETYNDMMEEEIVTEDNFEELVVPYVIDIEAEPNDSAWFFYFVSIILGIVAVIFALVQFVMNIRTKNHIKKYAKIYDLGNITTELTDPTNIEFKKSKTIFTKNYLISYSDSLVIFKYTDIVWVYTMDYRVNGVITTRRIAITNRENKKQLIAETSVYGKENQEDFQNTLQEICKRRPNALVGYTKENITAMKKENFANTLAEIEVKDI